MRVRFWGTRGSIPTPGESTAFYGGNTSCVEVRPSDDSVIILDCGTGIRELGAQLLRSKDGISRVHLLIGHTHWDHIQGLPFFAPAFLPGIELHICAPVGFKRSLQDAIGGQMQYSYFPFTLEDLSCRIYYMELGEGFFRIGDVLVETRYLNHTAPTLAYRLTDGLTSLAYVTDHEPFWSVPGPVFLHPGDRQHVEFLRNCDLIIHDAQYTAEEYQTKRGWGHGTIEYATDIAVAARAGKLALFHHDPMHDDVTLKKLEETARERAASFGSDIEIFCAAEGYELEVNGQGKVSSANGASALEGPLNRGGQVLVLSESPTDGASIRASLAEEGCVITVTSDIRSALAIVEHSCPEVVMMSASIGGDIAKHIEALRNASGNTELPVLLLTGAVEDSERLVITQDLATDYIAKPFSPPMLRCRVHAWRARTNGTQENSESVPAQPQKKPQESVTAGTLLASSSIFSFLKPAELFQLIGNSSEIYSPGHEIVRQGDYSDSVYAVLSGGVRVVQTVAETDAPLILGEFGTGEIFGELGVLRNAPRSATVVSVKETKCLKIPKADFIEALENSTELRRALLAILAERMNHTERLLGRHVPDSVTGLPSRRAFGEMYSRFASRAVRRKSPLLLLALDVLDLKSVNDQYGYEIGDNVLRAVADTLTEVCRHNGMVARYGGDEFAVLLMDTGEEEKLELIKRIRALLQQAAVRRSLPISISCSIGCAASQAPPETVDNLLRQADVDMHTKRGRRSPQLNSI
jgi:diguanylate cyclase (GGDEF)-like protein